MAGCVRCRIAKRKSGLRCSFYTEAIYATLNGQGVTLGWRRLVDDLLVQGRLVRLTDWTVKTRNAYFAVVPKRRRQTEACNHFQVWLTETAKQIMTADHPDSR
ncbi:LysR substrate-binding domain-containing protein (plasmid) [Rhizobium sp. 32-5/1]|uniref:LysR substrate-binding domain-containing protein n=1 Tax=Rhizobium sp. 32-5/1 TaxID=3019602 RepID=UPI00240D2D23|nr:LysR substrate-binding domain-containing protein [Rhizobium sp. 32-5/1]WEZ85944.1 LysR substrate-binding domain-containing protein [Rhizobium sp. 32-5/1]